MKKILVALFCITLISPVICVTHPNTLHHIESTPTANLSHGEYDFDFVNSDSAPTKITIFIGRVESSTHIALYFRWDQDNIDSTYQSNVRTPHRLDSQEKSILFHRVIYSMPNYKNNSKMNSTLPNILSDNDGLCG